MGSAAVVAPLAGPASAAEVEKSCSATREINRDDVVKANVALCTETDGNRLTVRMSGDCFVKTIGWSRYDSCQVDGSWRLTRDGAEVVAGDLHAVPYPGPGSYELTATVIANGRTNHSGGARSEGVVQGTVSVPVTFTSAPTGPRLSASVQPGEDGKTLTLTITNTGPGKAGSVVMTTSNGRIIDWDALIALDAVKQYRRALATEPVFKGSKQSRIDRAKSEMDSYAVNQAAQTEDPRCASNKEMSECELGTLAGGASTTIVFTAEYAGDLTWRITSPDNVGAVAN
ncbi:hypothetical protein F3087_16070 [Nocardia colli]|uniref:Uncharacterized protein n=1 Tax=Nocardia colli TaxID=2545717 RepID=A0A5N0EGK5_9NOCA|nr:hypothetical protein [Nocardia colli]KAA8888518.1 hypothetical protein F3087_16070 [Nocardia colli]